MIHDAPLCDWLRLTSWEPAAVEAFHEVVRSRPEEEEEGFWHQYRGPEAGPVFAGVAEQNGKLHGFFQVTGSESHSYVGWEWPAVDIRCTRIDLQMTIALAKGYKARVFKDALEAADWNGDTVASRVHRRPVLMHEGPSDKGLDQVEIGSRASARFIRVYVKQDADGKKYLRFEVEFKGALGRAVYDVVKADRSKIGAVLRAEWERVPSVPVEAWQAIGRKLAGWADGSAVSVPRCAADMDSRYQWFAKTVVPGLETLLNDHEVGYKVRRILRDMVGGPGLLG